MIKYVLDGNVVCTPKVWKFPAGEVGVRLLGNVMPERISSVQILASIQSSDDVMSLLMTTDAIRRMYVNASVSLKLGYIPYGRQDRVMTPGESLSIKVFANLINSQGYSEVTLIDPHSAVTEAVFDRARIMQQRDVFKLFCRLPWGIDSLNTVMVAPDAGAAKKVDTLDMTRFTEIYVANKVRDLATGKIIKYDFTGDVFGRDVIVMDDIIDNGGTFIALGKELKAQGAKSCILMASHGIFGNGTTELLKYYDSIITTNSYHMDRVGFNDDDRVNYVKVM